MAENSNLPTKILILDDDRIVIATPNQTFDRENGVGGIGHRLTLGGLTDQTFIVGKGDAGWRGARAF